MSGEDLITFTWAFWSIFEVGNGYCITTPIHSLDIVSCALFIFNDKLYWDTNTFWHQYSVNMHKCGFLKLEYGIYDVRNVWNCSKEYNENCCMNVFGFKTQSEKKIPKI